MKKLLISGLLITVSIYGAPAVLWQDAGDLGSGSYSSAPRGLASGSTVTSISDPTGSGMGEVIEVRLGGGSTGTEWGSLEMATSPSKIADKIVWDGTLIPGTTEITLTADAYIPISSTMAGSDNVGFLVRTESNNLWWDNSGGEWNNSFSTPNLNTAVKGIWQTISTTVTLPAEAGGSLPLNGLFPLVTFNDYDNNAGSGVFVYLDNISISAENPPSFLTASVSVNAGTHRFIGKEHEFDRSRFFTMHGDAWIPSSVKSHMWDTNEIYVAQSRYSSAPDQISSQIWWPPSGTVDYLDEDLPANPGFVDPAETTYSVGQYNNWINDWSGRFEPLQRYALTENKNVIVMCGRNIAGRYPTYLLTDPDTAAYHAEIPLNHPGYADMINKIVSQIDYPVESDRFYFEIMNEPNFTSGYSVSQCIALHNEVPPLIRAVHPNLLIGGPSYGATGFRDFSSWDTNFRQVMAGAGAQLDFWSFHPYDRNDLNGSTLSRGVITSAGRVTANMDLIENYSQLQFGSPKKQAITEYGEWNLVNSGDYSVYPREERMWDQVVAVLEKMMIFIDRPDRVLVATPFINTYKGGGGGASPEGAWSNHLWIDNDSGVVTETTVAKMYRFLHDITGTYVEVDSDHRDLQVQAFRNGNTVYLLLNSLSSFPLVTDLSIVAGGFGTVDSAIHRRLYMTNNVAQYDPGTAIGDWSEVTLQPEEKSLIIFSLGGSQTFDVAHNEVTFYGDSSTEAFASGVASIDVTTSLDQALAAKVRVGFMRPGDGTVPDIIININGTPFPVAGGLDGYDDTDARVSSREIDVPLSALNDGNNTVTVTFPSTGSGHLMSAVIILTKAYGDYNANDIFDSTDRDQITANIGMPVSAATEKYDLNGDGSIDSFDVAFFDELRGAVAVVPFVITDAAQAVPGSVDLTWASVPSKTYSVQVSTNLVGGAWAALVTNYPPTGASTTYTDATFATRENSFYRILEE